MKYQLNLLKMYAFERLNIVFAWELNIYKNTKMDYNCGSVGGMKIYPCFYMTDFIPLIKSLLNVLRMWISWG